MQWCQEQRLVWELSQSNTALVFARHEFLWADSIVVSHFPQLSSLKRREPAASLGIRHFFGVPWPVMKNARPSTSRRRADQPLLRKTFVYLTSEERRLIDEAAASERRSISSFIANAAVEAAERVVRRASKKA